MRNKHFIVIVTHAVIYYFACSYMYSTPSLAATYNKMLIRPATVVQVLQDLF